jgi:hypothetical protein
VTNPPATTEPTSEPVTAPPPPTGRWSWRHVAAAAVAGVALVVAVIAVVLALAGSGTPGPATGAATIVPADALAYLNVSLDQGRSAVRQALSVTGRFPDSPLAAGAVLTRLDAILSGGRSSVDFATQVRPWLGNEAALALLNTPTATAGSLIALAVKDPARARSFLGTSGATPHGSYRGTALETYPTGAELAFVHGFLVLGQDASVRSAIDVAAKATPSLAGSSVYQKAAAGEPSGRVADAYASLAGVRRLLAPQNGLVGALGNLLYQPALEGVAVAVSPTTGGARIQIHSVLDPTLEKLSPPATPAFTPTLQNVMPTGSILMLDVTRLDRIAPHVLSAGATAGLAGGLGPLLSRLGAALGAEGINVANIVSIFDRETAVSIVPSGTTPTLVIVARTPNQSKTAAELASLEVPLAQLFKAAGTSFGSGKEALFNDRQVGGVTAHQLALANGFQLDYAVVNGLVVISTSLQGIAAVVQRTHALGSAPAFRSVLGARPPQVSSLVYLDIGQLLALGKQTGLTSSARFSLLQGDADKVQAVGLTSTHAQDQSTSVLTVHILG